MSDKTPQEAEIEQLRQECDYYRDALAEVDRRIRESTKPLVDLVNRAMKEMPLTDDEKRAIIHAWKWGVYSTAIHAQIAITYRDTLPQVKHMTVPPEMVDQVTRAAFDAGQIWRQSLTPEQREQLLTGTWQRSDEEKGRTADLMQAMGITRAENESK